MAYKHGQYSEEKKRIGKYAASLIKKSDFVFIDAGTTTEALIDYISEKEATYVTDGLGHANKLLKKGYKVFIPGGHLRVSTEAMVGEETVEALRKYNFTLGFLASAPRQGTLRRMFMRPWLRRKPLKTAGTLTF